MQEEASSTRYNRFVSNLLHLSVARAQGEESKAQERADLSSFSFPPIVSAIPQETRSPSSSSVLDPSLTSLEMLLSISSTLSNNVYDEETSNEQW